MEFCNTYGGSDGGELSSRLAMYPFLMQVRPHRHPYNVYNKMNMHECTVI